MVPLESLLARRQVAIQSRNGHAHEGRNICRMNTIGEQLASNVELLLMEKAFSADTRFSFLLRGFQWPCLHLLSILTTIGAYFIGKPNVEFFGLPL
jgi:hypothetical protein